MASFSETFQNKSKLISRRMFVLTTIKAVVFVRPTMANIELLKKLTVNYGYQNITKKTHQKKIKVKSNISKSGFKKIV